MVDYKKQYLRRKSVMLDDKSICAANRELIKKFLEYEEYKLQRKNQLPSLDDGCCKTLYGYLTRLKTVNDWFDNQPWIELSKTDIKRIYDGLEDGKILNARGSLSTTLFGKSRAILERLFPM